MTALENVPTRGGERLQWREALEATRGAWEAAWHGEPGPGAGLTPALLDALNGSRYSDE
jgi:hypothetical protein